MKTKFQLLVLGTIISLLYILAVAIAQWPDNNLHLIMCDVGQGDALLITEGFTQILIDGGRSDEPVLECLQEFMPFWDGQIEFLIATHPDADHIGGLDAVLQRYQIGAIFLTTDSKDTVQMTDFEHLVTQAADTAGTKIIRPTFSGSIIALNHGSATVFVPDLIQVDEDGSSKSAPETILSDSLSANSAKKTKKINYNDRSIQLLLRFGKYSALLTGDLEKEGEAALLARGVIPDVDVLKIAHHGSKSSTTRSFLEVSRPEYVLISSGKNNNYGHPSPEVIERLQGVGAEIFRTDSLGAVELVSDGEQLWWFPERQPVW